MENLIKLLVIFPIVLISIIALVPINICVVTAALSYILGNLTPLENIPKVITTRDYKFLNIWIASATCLNALIWAYYAFLEQDVFILLPQIMGFQVGII